MTGTSRDESGPRREPTRRPTRCRVVLLHGFAGSPESWSRVEALLGLSSTAPALLGHGAPVEASSGAGRRPGSAFEAEVDRLAMEIRSRLAGAPCFLVGYSQGGRVALGLLARHRHLFLGAALIGANPGIDRADRPARRQSDEAWARLIEEQGAPAFERRWSELPLFRSQQRLVEGVLAEQRRIRLGHDPNGLAAAMRALGLAAMPDYRPALPTIDCPVELIVGGLDRKFEALARQMAKRMPKAAVHVVDGVGHNVPLEAPAELARILRAAVERAENRVAPGASGAL